jgi:hypothetical protein
MAILKNEPPRLFKMQQTINDITFDRVYDLIEIRCRAADVRHSMTFVVSRLGAVNTGYRPRSVEKADFAPCPGCARARNRYAIAGRCGSS